MPKLNLRKLRSALPEDSTGAEGVPCSDVAGVELEGSVIVLESLLRMPAVGQGGTDSIVE